MLTYEALGIGYRSHCGVDIIQDGFGLVSSCLDLCSQENFLPFLFLALYRDLKQQDLEWQPEGMQC